MRIASPVPVALLVGATASTAAGPSLPISPGMWENNSSVTSIDAPGMPPQVLAMMKKPHSIRHCVTPEAASRGPDAAMKGDKSCTSRNVSMTGGTFNVSMTCKGMTLTSHGSYSPTSYSASGTMVTSQGPSGSGMKMSFTGSGRLIGPCK